MCVVEFRDSLPAKVVQETSQDSFKRKRDRLSRTQDIMLAQFTNIFLFIANQTGA